MNSVKLGARIGTPRWKASALAVVACGALAAPTGCGSSDDTSGQGGAAATSTTADTTTTTVTTTSSTGSGGGGGGGCTTADDCAPALNECETPTCNDGVCGADYADMGTPLASQDPGDCQLAQCDGAGGVESVDDDTDILDDGNPCTTDSCVAGAPNSVPVPVGTECGQGLICDGARQCVGCIDATDCPGVDDDCQTRTCELSVCGLDFTPEFTSIMMQTAGDCVDVQCDGVGSAFDADDDNDLPVDNNDCTADVCAAGAMSNPDLAAGTACSIGVCDGAGTCVECNVAADCSSGSCVATQCETCTDGMQNGLETAVDCGGNCGGCAVGVACMVGTDCLTGLCTGNVCASGSVLGTTPADAATGVLESASISVTFSTAMDPATLTAQTTAGACTGSLQVSTDGFATCIALAAAAPTMSAANTVATLAPSPWLSFGSTFKVRVTTAALDANGGMLAGAYTSATGFTTGVQGPTCNGGQFVVISQVYGGGGNAGAQWDNDFIELHNRGSVPVVVDGWSVQYASAAGTTWSKTDLAGSILPGGYYLVQEGGGALTPAPLPPPDATGAIAVSATAGKIALVSNTTLLTTKSPVGFGIIDFVGYGTTAGTFEGSGPAPAPSATKSVIRGAAGCTDAGNNATDFTALTPVPLNSAAVVATCTCDNALNEAGALAEADYCVIQSPQNTITVAAGVATPLVKGRIYELGVTPTAGADASIVAQVGYGPVTANPENQAGWQWSATTFNLQSGNDDEYQSTLTVATPGTYNYGFRFSFNGADWTYCDINGAGSNAGLSFETTQLPQLVVQ